MGLGNPGKEYVRSRHNVGFMCADRWAERHGISFDKKRPWAVIGEGELDSCRVMIAKPRTFMNLSGDAVHEMANRWHVQPKDLLVLYDDMDLPLGSLRLRERGSAGGHNGIKSIIERLGSQEFLRLRIGIGRPNGDADAIRHVLSQFTRDEAQVLDEALDRACDAIDCILSEGITPAMNKFNPVAKV